VQPHLHKSRGNPPDSLSERVSARASATMTSNYLACTCSALNSTKHHDSGYTPTLTGSDLQWQQHTLLKAYSLGKHGRDDVNPRFIGTGNSPRCCKAGKGRRQGVLSDYLSDYLNFGMLHCTAGSVSFHFPSPLRCRPLALYRHITFLISFHLFLCIPSCIFPTSFPCVFSVVCCTLDLRMGRRFRGFALTLLGF
jgi:hypothetical protein